MDGGIDAIFSDDSGATWETRRLTGSSGSSYVSLSADLNSSMRPIIRAAREGGNLEEFYTDGGTGSGSFYGNRDATWTQAIINSNYLAVKRKKCGQT